VEIKCQQMFFIADIIACSTCFGHHYYHHQELESIIQLVAACGLWCLIFKLLVCCEVEGCVSGLRGAAVCLQSAGTQYTHHSLKYLLPQHRKSYNDIFLLINSTIL
jgi:hypothetical protein